MRQAVATGNSQTVVAGVSLSAPATALVNGTAAHALDYDDCEIPGSTHPSAAIIPALLAINDLAESSYG
jgi:2-methylcitrate dehydratase PrpD